MKFTFIQTLVMIMPLALVTLLIVFGNYKNSLRPIISKGQVRAYLILAGVIGFGGFIGAFGTFELIVPGFHKVWGACVFSGSMLFLWVNQVKGKAVKTEGNVNA